MAQMGANLDHHAFSCSICLDLLVDPVTLPCGHSYCMRCIKLCWDRQRVNNIHSCPQCRQRFRPRPVLVKNTMMAHIVEEVKKIALRNQADGQSYAGPGDVCCDLCTGRKHKAVKSCLVCLVSYCHTHLQPHYESAAFEKHKLVDPSENLQENICSRHGEVMKMFCRTDHQRICYMCPVDEHKGHDTVSAAAESTQKQRELEVSRQKTQQRINDKEKDVKVLQQEAQAINRSADEAVMKSHGILIEVIQLMEQRRREVEQHIRTQQEAEVSRVKELESKLQQEITELRRRDAEMDKLSRIHDHNQFLLHYPLVRELGEHPDSPRVHVRPLTYFEDVMAAVSNLRDKLHHSLTEGWTHTSLTLTLPQVLLQPEPQTREEFLQYSREITLDPNTVNDHLFLCEENNMADCTFQTHDYSHHPDRFSDWYQVLSTESLTGRCYWEVEWSGIDVWVSVAYKDINRKGSSDECAFGLNNKSWALHCTSNSIEFYHNRLVSCVPGRVSSRIGVYLDHGAGILSFYHVCQTMTLIYRVQTTFTRPLYAGLRFEHVFLGFEYSARFPKLP